MWPELQKARENAKLIERSIEELQRNQNSLKKAEISKHSDLLISDIENATERIENQAKEMMKNLSDHKKYVSSKSRFLKRYYAINKDK
jgi:hypothetical protein